MPAAFTRTSPVSSTQYAVVPVEFNVTGVALTEKPVLPDTPQAAGTPAVKESVPLGVNVKPCRSSDSARLTALHRSGLHSYNLESQLVQLIQRQRVTVAEGGREGFLCRRNRTEGTDCRSLVRGNLGAEQVGNCDSRDDQDNRHDDQQFDQRKALLFLVHCFSLKQISVL